MITYETKHDCDKTNTSETITQMHVKMFHENKFSRQRKKKNNNTIYMNWRSLTSCGAIHVVVTFCFTSEFAWLTAEFCNEREI